MPWKKGSRLRLVRESEAPPGICAIYGEIKEALGLPYVSVVFQALASCPHFLELQWEQFRPVVNSQKFFELCDRIRADAYTRAHNYFQIPDLCAKMKALSFSAGAKEELSETIEQFYYATPLLLVIVAAQQQALEGPVGVAGENVQVKTHPIFEEKPVLVDDQSAPPETLKAFEEVKRVLGMPAVINDFRALARWPDFLRAYWEFLNPLLLSPLYQQSQHGIYETAWGLVGELPGPFELTVPQMLESGMKEDEITSVVRLTQAFTSSLSGTMLNVAIAKIGVEGGNQNVQQEGERTDTGQPRQVA